jgi:hypothetical protein
VAAAAGMAVVADDPAGEDGTKRTLARTHSPFPGHADSEGAIVFPGCVRMRHSGQTVRIAHRCGGLRPRTLALQSP